MSRVLVTGGTRGIGLAAVRRFLDDGDEVIIAARHTSSEFTADQRVRIIQCDLADRNAVRCLPQETGEIDILVNNAGVMQGIPFDRYSDAEADHILHLNLFAPVILSEIYGQSMAARGGGRIVNVASQAAIAGHPDIWYGMTKAALVNFTKSLAGLLGESGVLINAVSPGPVETEMVAGSPYGERFARIRRRTYLGRFAQTDEIAGVIHWLAKESPAYLNGENIVVNNGALGLEMA